RGVLELERTPDDRALVARLLRLAHTLKGAARVVQQPAIGDLAHAAEDALAAHRDDGGPPVQRETIDALLRGLDGMAARVAGLEPPPAEATVPPPEGFAGPPAAPADAVSEQYQSVRVDVHELDALLASALEASIQVAALRRQLRQLDHAQEVARALAEQLSARRGEVEGAPPMARLRPLVDELRRTLDVTQRAVTDHADLSEAEIGQVRSSADRLRLLPARALAAPLARAVRDAARSLGREALFEVVGGDVRVETNVLAAVRDALLHVVRNAVAHGIEPGAGRAAAGKRAVGRVWLEVERRGRKVIFRCRDDGRGVDVAAVRAAAVRKGLLDPAAPAPAGGALSALLLRGGLSTSPEVTAVSGRGVGLDVLRDVAARLQAEASLRSEAGRGTTVELEVPVSLSALTALRLEAGGVAAALPLDAVEQALFLPPDQLASAAAGAGLPLEGEVLPFLPLAAILAPGAPARGRRPWSAVVVRSGTRRVVLGADRLLGTCELVVRPLPAHVQAQPTVLGAALDAEGQPGLVLDPAGLVEAASRGAGPIADAPRPPRHPILVVDDSLTTRMLEQSILESAGYEVELAVSAEDALERCRRRRFGLFVVDVEMPGMDGYEFVRTMRADAASSSIPAILVTSRAAEEDRQRGLEAGASAYIVKGEFDQKRLLKTIEELLA
ncbi:MAG TPA: response regulator, partial [Anaeromyxobacteraceae bacterium]